MFKDDNHSSYSEDLIIEKLLKYPNQIIILCVGPVTNLYRAEMKHPGVLALTRDIYIMGGTFESGNIDADNEFNSLSKFVEIINGIEGAVPNVFIFPLDVTKIGMECGAV